MIWTHLFVALFTLLTGNSELLTREGRTSCPTAWVAETFANGEGVRGAFPSMRPLCLPESGKMPDLREGGSVIREGRTSCPTASVAEIFGNGESVRGAFPSMRTLSLPESGKMPDLREGGSVIRVGWTSCPTASVAQIFGNSESVRGAFPSMRPFCLPESGKMTDLREGDKHPAGLFYQITKAGSSDTSYLFGTLHLLEQSYVDTMPALMRALDRADIILGEIVLDSAAKKAAATLTAADAPLDDVLTPKQYARVDSELQRLMGVPLQFFNGFQPLAVGMVLMKGYFKKEHPENVRNGMVMDLYFQHLGRKAGKEVRGLESISDEADALFGSMTTKSQVDQLMDLINHKAKVLRKLNEMLETYQAGDLAKIITEDNMQGTDAKLMGALLTKRNAAWLKELPAILNAHNAFIAVGAGHLGGKRGLVEGLRKRGFTVVAVSPI